MKKFTKIVATVSDQRCEVDFVRSLFEAGMNVARLNTAHLDFEGINKIVTNIREISDEIAILVDTKGPEVRTTVADGDIELKTGAELFLVGDPDGKTNAKRICVSYPDIAEDVSVGSQILIDDGELALEVLSKENGSLKCRVMNNGVLGSRKSVNVPGVRINLPSLTQRDKAFIGYAIENKIDFIAHSFVRNKEDVQEIQKILDQHDSPVKIIAKIENQEGVENIDEILENVYGVMVARGDLGIEIPQE
ncbi:MAG: pyruvate kinase, partial [Bacteroidota bacterium]